MPRSGSGIYTPTAGVPVVSGTTISSTMFNNLVTDIGNELTASLPVAGTAPMTGQLRAVIGSASAPGYTFVGDTNTGIYSAGADTLNLATAGTLAMTVSSTQTTTWAGKAVGKAFDVDATTSVASASTCDIGAAATSEILITGTTTITAFGTSNAGIRRRGTFAGILTLTHNATSLILPGGANITTAAGDYFEAVSLGSGNWAVTSYTRKAGIPGAVLQVQTYTDAGSSTASTSMVNANAGNFSFTPKSASSTLIIQATAQCGITAIAATNTIGQAELRESGSLIGSTYTYTASAVTDGVAWQGPVAVQVALSNSATTTRLFTFYHKTNNAGATVSTTLIKCTIWEIAV